MLKKLGLPALMIALIGGLGLWAGQSPTTPGQSLLPGLAAQAQEAPATTAALPAVPDMVLGQADAPVTLIEYASYTCPHCANFHAAVFKDLKRDYVDTGKVKLVFREVYFDRYGLWASMMARCGGETRYFGISGMLFEAQKQWAASDDPGAVVDNLRRIGKTAGMDDATLDTCLKNGAMAQAMIETYETNAKADNVEGTPTLILNGVKHGNMAYADLKALIDAELAK
ncbi:MAG: DsbA family protein [Gemmobacter sp.]